MMKIRHRLYMHPLKKYEKYGYFPWKMVVQLLLVLFTTMQIWFIVNQNTSYAYTQYTVFNRFFLNHDVQGSDTTITNTFNIFSTAKLKSYIQESVNRYYNFNSYTIDNYNYFYKSTGLKKPPRLLSSYLDTKVSLDKGWELEYELLSNSLGPFSSDDVEDYLHNVKEFYIEFKMLHHLPSHVDLSSGCYQWTIKQKYSFKNHGTIIVELLTDRIACDHLEYNIVRNYIWVSLAVLLLGFFSFMNTVREVVKRFRVVAEVRGGLQQYSRAWEQLGIAEKLKFFDGWVIFAFFGNLFQIFSGILTLVNNNIYLNIHEIIIGFGCFFAWVGLVRFINHRSVSYTIVNTVERSGKTIGFYIIGVVPIFMGYAFLGMCYFWQTGIYYSTPMSMIANYALVNGDSVYAFSFAGFQETPFMGQLYYYTFIVFFICCVHNLFIAIIEGAFSSMREEKLAKKDEESSDSSDEEVPFGSMSPKQAKVVEMKERKRKSVLAYQKIMNVGKKDELAMYDENTLKVIQQMDALVKDVQSNLVSLEILSNGSFSYSIEIGELKEHLLGIIDNQLLPITEYFS